MSAGGRASLFSSAHLGTRLACLQIRALPWTGGWQWIQVAGGDKAASGTLQMQALAEWRLDGEPGQAEAFDNAADVYRLHSRIGHLLSSQETPGLCTLAQAQQTVWWCTQWRLHWKWLLLPPRCPFLRQLAKQKDRGYGSNCVSKNHVFKATNTSDAHDSAAHQSAFAPPSLTRFSPRRRAADSRQLASTPLFFFFSRSAYLTVTATVPFGI